MRKIIIALFTILLCVACASCDTEVGTSSSSSTTTATATTLKDTDGNTIYSGTATVSFNSTSVSISAAYLIDGVTVNITSGEYESASGPSDQVVFLVVNGGKLNITGTSSDPVVITKTGSAASGGQVGDDYNFYGINSVIVVAGSTSSADIDYATITSSSNGSNAVVSTVGASVEITNSTITTTGSAGSRGLHATYAGSVTADTVMITTSGASCAALATDRGGGTVIASNMTLETNKAGSPLVYSTGTIEVYNSTGNAKKAQMVVVEGNSIAYIEGCNFQCSGDGNRSGTSSSNSSSHTVDAAGIFIYQSMSGDSSVGTDYFTAKNSTFTVNGSDVPLFFLTNIDAVITLEGTNTFSYSGRFILAEATSAWGSGTSGAGVVVTSEQSLTGNTVYRDSYSTLKINGTTVSTVGSNVTL